MSITIPIKKLKQHPAQMRTVYDIEGMATLCLQIYERGLDEWQTLLASPNGEEGSYFIVSGHRRQMARLLAWALADWAADHPDKEITAEVARTMITTLVDSLGSLENVITPLLEKYGDREIPIVLFEGDKKAEILSLQSANYGSEQADMMGIAHSFRQAVSAGATPEEIGRNCGQSTHYVHNHLALTEISSELAQRIAIGELPMSVARTVADLPEPKRTGLSVFILANEPGKLTAKAIKTCATTLKKWTGLQMPLMTKHQSQRNIARALIRLWNQAAEAYPEDAYAAAAMLVYRNLHEEPWTNKEKLTLWFQALGGDTYFTDNRINWTAVTEYLITELNCETCPIAQLPNQRLRSDLSQGQGGPLGMPCRVNEEAARCIHGLASSDNFDVRVPWDWGQHPGVVNEDGEYRAKSYENLLSAWQTQLAREQAEDETAAATTDDEQTAITDTPQQTQEKRQSPTKKQPEAAPPAKDSPISKQRAQIVDFMKRHEQFAVSHPFATSCGHCRHRLDSSPTKDETVPHCAWAGRLRRVYFKTLKLEDKQAQATNPAIPVCRQFAPSQAWHELLPPHSDPPGVPRDWLKRQILHLVKSANQRSGEGNAFEFLTGRPMSANENYSDWFAQQMQSQGGELNDAQMFTLFIWAHSEWQRAGRGSFTLPVNGNSVQFGMYQERGWQVSGA